MSIAPGWYPDPADPANMRYWDGEGWADQPVPTTADLRAEKAAAEKAAAERAAAEADVATLPPARAGVPRGEAPPWWPEGIVYPPTALVRPHGLDLASPGRRL